MSNRFPLLLPALLAATLLPAAETRSPRDAGRPVPTRRQVNTPPRRDAPVNDREIFRYLEVEGLKLIESGRTATNLHRQLDRKTCQLKLASPAVRKFSLAETAARAEMAVVALAQFFKCDKCSRTHCNTATGFLLTESGALATCAHVIKPGSTLGLVALTRDGKLCPVREVLAADSLNDLVILQLDGAGFTPLPLSTNAPVGAPIIVMSHPQGHYYMLTAGIVSRHFVQQKKDGLCRMMSITADFAKGSSGAPVLNESAGVVGVVNNTQSIYYDTDHDQKDNFQMTVHNCTPAQALLKMIRPL